MKRHATAVWQGSTKEGKGHITTQSGVLSETQYSFSTRFEDGIGTNPEELVAAGHAGCFTMALSLFLGMGGMTAETITTKATLTLDRVDTKWLVTNIHLDVVAKIPGADPAAFETAAAGAKAECPISKLFNTSITMDARLEG